MGDQRRRPVLTGGSLILVPDGNFSERKGGTVTVTSSVGFRSNDEGRGERGESLLFGVQFADPIKESLPLKSAKCHKSSHRPG